MNGHQRQREQSAEMIEGEFFARYSAGGFLMLLHCWIAEGMQEAPEAYAEKISGALRIFIQSAARRADVKNPRAE